MSVFVIGCTAIVQQENMTYPTQYMSGGLGVQLSQGRRLSFGACPFTLYVPRKKLKQKNDEK